MRLPSVGDPEEFWVSTTLADSIQAFTGERLRIMGYGWPVAIRWPWTKSYSNKQNQLYNLLDRDSHLRNILVLLSRSESGLSNAEIDTALSNHSQWTTIQHLRELMVVGLIEYRLELFGNPGKYLITALGLSMLERTGTQPNHR